MVEISVYNGYSNIMDSGSSIARISKREEAIKNPHNNCV